MLKPNTWCMTLARYIEMFIRLPTAVDVIKLFGMKSRFRRYKEVEKHLFEMSNCLHKIVNKF